jgi:hypothetical protein
MITNYREKKVKAHRGAIDQRQVEQIAAVGSFVYIESGGLLRSV